MKKPDELPSIEDLVYGDAQVIADECGIPICWVDHQATRRQRIHGANIPGDTACFTSTHFNELLQHLDRQGFVDAIFICETPRRQHLACYIEFQPLEPH
jgi:hypothetical protein